MRTRSRAAAPRADRSRLAARQRAHRRASTPPGVSVLVNWAFNGWAKYDNWQLDAGVGPAVERDHRAAARGADAPGHRRRLVLEGGGIETNGTGPAARHRGVARERRAGAQSRPDAGRLRAGCLPNGSARGARSGSAKAAWATTRTGTSMTSRASCRPTRSCWRSKPDPADENHARSMDNVRRLQLASTDPGRRAVARRAAAVSARRDDVAERLPASYANFYIANGVVIVPTFNDPNDRVALAILADAVSRSRGRRHPRRSISCGGRARCTA